VDDRVVCSATSVVRLLCVRVLFDACLEILVRLSVGRLVVLAGWLVAFLSRFLFPTGLLSSWLAFLCVILPGFLALADWLGLPQRSIACAAVIMSRERGREKERKRAGRCLCGCTVGGRTVSCVGNERS